MRQKDICEYNIVVNHFRLDQDHRSGLKNDLREHRRGDNVLYAFMDFDQSIQLPVDTSLKTCRRPFDESFHGSEIYKSDDALWGAPYYNPFAFDVAMLGNLFRFHFCVCHSSSLHAGVIDQATFGLQTVVPAVPALVVLFDRMTTHVMDDRFTAEEAYDFFRDSTHRLPEDTLKTRLELVIGFDAMADSDVYWSKLSPPLQKTWARYRTPPLPWWAYLLDRVLSYKLGWRLVVFVRRVLQF